MKRDEIDDRLGALLKEHTPQAADSNEWFTRKVLNRLPPKPKRSYTWLTVATYIVCFAVCIMVWLWFFLSLTPGIILVKDVVVAAILVVVTVALLWYVLRSMLRSSEAWW